MKIEIVPDRVLTIDDGMYSWSDNYAAILFTAESRNDFDEIQRLFKELGACENEVRGSRPVVDYNHGAQQLRVPVHFTGALRKGMEA